MPLFFRCPKIGAPRFSGRERIHKQGSHYTNLAITLIGGLKISMEIINVGHTNFPVKVGLKI